MTARLSATQRRVLTYLANGEEVLVGFGPTCLTWRCAGEAVRNTTVERLLQDGWIGWQGGELVITATGRAALTEEEEG